MLGLCSDTAHFELSGLELHRARRPSCQRRRRATWRLRRSCWAPNSGGIQLPRDAVSYRPRELVHRLLLVAPCEVTPKAWDGPDVRTGSGIGCSVTWPPAWRTTQGSRPGLAAIASTHSKGKSGVFVPPDRDFGRFGCFQTHALLRRSHVGPRIILFLGLPMDGVLR